MKVLPAVCLLALLLAGTKAFIVPDEIPSVLSLIYSNIPTIKKGTDSRVGWGFRLGDRADFQVLLELGPQTNTQPLANQREDNSSRKRNANNNKINNLYAQYHDNRQKQILQAQNTISSSEGSKWLNEWKQNAKNKPIQTPTYEYKEEVIAKPGLGIGEIDAKSVIPDDSILQLREMYRKHPKEVLEVLESLAKFATTEKPKITSTTSKEDALDNVEIN